jgi:hypothetical protein
MPEQPQWSERTLDMPPQDPWADPPTAPTPAAARASVPPPAPADPPFSAGRARVDPHPRSRPFAAEHEPTGTGWPGAEPPPPPRHTMRELRRGGEWTMAALLWAFVCWGIWAISAGGDLTTQIIVFVVSVVVAGGLFALSRLVGRIVLERQFHRVRRSARGSHLVASTFLVGVGLAHLQQTDWVMNALRWVLGTLS